MRKSLGTVLLFFGMGMLVAQFGLMFKKVFCDEAFWVFLLSIIMIYGGLMLIDPSDKGGGKNE